MAIAYPLDILSTFPGWSTEFDLQWRQEQSRSANGKTWVKDLGAPLWKATYQSRSLSPNELDAWRARLKALENGLQTFIGQPLSRWYPIAYPNGSWPTGAAFSGAGQVAGKVGKSISLKGFPVGYVLSVGDYVQVGDTDLFQVLENRVADAVGAIASFDVRPYVWPTVAIDQVAKVKKPACIMSLIPDSVTSTADAQTGRGSITFQAMEAR